MKKVTLMHTVSLVLILIIGFSACQKDNPIPEDNQEEFNSAKITFVELTAQNGGYLEGEESTVIAFDKEGKPSPHHIHLTEGKSYRMKIELFYNGESINQEIIDEADQHQFFFLGAPDGVLDYAYEDEKIGLEGIMRIIEHGEFDLQVILRHGLNKGSADAQQWNSKTYAKAGGTDDMNVSFEIHIVEEGGTHDH